MIMGDWIEIFQEFNELAGERWKITLNRMLRGKDQEVPLKVVFKKLTVTVKYMLMENRSEEIQELKELLNNQVLYDLLMQYEEEKMSRLNCYSEKLELLYMLGNKKKGDAAIERTFENVIVKYNETFFLQFKEYGFESEEEFRKFTHMLDSIVMAAIARRLGKAGIEEFLAYRFPQEDELIQKITEQYIKYYDELRNRYQIEIAERKSENTEKIQDFPAG